jgi:hypothetical protein
MTGIEAHIITEICGVIRTSNLDLEEKESTMPLFYPPLSLWTECKA